MKKIPPLFCRFICKITVKYKIPDVLSYEKKYIVFS